MEATLAAEADRLETSPKRVWRKQPRSVLGGDVTRTRARTSYSQLRAWVNWDTPMGPANPLSFTCLPGQHSGLAQGNTTIVLSVVPSSPRVWGMEEL